jgi:hypothetical protein
MNVVEGSDYPFAFVIFDSRGRIVPRNDDLSVMLSEGSADGSVPQHDLLIDRAAARQGCQHEHNSEQKNCKRRETVVHGVNLTGEKVACRVWLL